MKKILNIILACTIACISCNKNTEPTESVVIVTTQSATSISQDSAVLGGEIKIVANTDEYEAFIYWSENAKDFEYLPIDFEQKVSAGKFTKDGTFSCTVSGLKPKTTYYYTAVAMADMIRFAGKTKSFTTK